MVAALIILQAAILGVLIGGGFWLRYVVKQQLSLKDGEIRALRSEKERFEGLTADIFAVREERLSKGYARATEELEAKEKEIEKLKITAKQKEEIEITLQQLKQEKEKEPSKRQAEVLRAMGIGFVDGARAIQEIIEFQRRERGVLKDILLIEKLRAERDSLYEQAEKALHGKRPDISRVAEFMARSDR